MKRTDRDDDGSLLVELAILAPVLFLFALAAVAFGRVTETHQLVVEASRAGAEAAAVLPDAGSAQAGAAEVAVVAIFAHAQICGDAQVTTDTSRFAAGGSVTVTVTCQVGLSDLAVPGLPGSTTIRASSTAPIDPYRAIG